MIKIPVEPQITQYLHIKAAKNLMPLNGTFEITPVCNMDCRMCYVRMSKSEQESIRPLRSAAEWLELAKQAKDMGMLYLLITGGEPFLHPQFKEIMQGLHRMGFIISINSNGTMIDEETVEWLKETPPVRINMTLYGASDETYGTLCGKPDGFTKYTKAVKLLTEAGIPVKVNMSLTQYNADDIEEMFAYTNREKLIVQATSYMFPPIRKDQSSIGFNDRFTPEDAAYYSAKIEQLMNGDDNFLERMKSMDFTLPAENEDDCLDVEGEGITCRAGKCSFWITWEGKCLPCGMIINDAAPNVFESGFEKAWESVVEYTKAIRLPGKCKDCELKSSCRACAAMALSETGRYDMVPEYRCQMSKCYPEALKRVKEEIERKKGNDE